jgi:hypothetical protein
MAKFNKGYVNIKVKLLSFEGDNLAKRAYQFGVYGSDSYEIPTNDYLENKMEVERFVSEVLNGTTFPKFLMEATRIEFSVEGISRICLAQLTRDNAIFCSESHGLRPLSQEFNIPLNIANDESIMSKVEKAQNLLEEAYVECCEKEIPFPESRYICLHSQTISLTCSFTPASFARACYSRTNNSFCDELNYVYRKMFYEISKSIKNLKDKNSIILWNWLINEKKCIDDNFYSRTNVFNGDFLPFHQSSVKAPAQNDWRKSCWKMELERIATEEPWLLTDKEKSEIKSWMTYDSKGHELPTTYDENLPRAAKNSIKTMSYYKEKNNAKRR